MEPAFLCLQQNFLKQSEHRSLSHFLCIITINILRTSFEKFQLNDQQGVLQISHFVVLCYSRQENEKLSPFDNKNWNPMHVLNFFYFS